MQINHPLYKQAYLYFELEQAIKNFCTQNEFSEPVVQISLKTKSIDLTVKLSSSSELTMLKLNQDQLFEHIINHLTQKKLWDEQELILRTKLK